MYRMILGGMMMLFVLLVAITYEQQPGDPKTYANMLGGVIALIGVPGAALFIAGWRANNIKK